MVINNVVAIVHAATDQIESDKNVTEIYKHHINSV